MVFSQRVVLFHQHTVTWECHCAVWHKGEVPENYEEQCTSRFSDMARGMHYSSWLDFGEYTRLVLNYSRRSFTYEDDILQASLVSQQRSRRPLSAGSISDYHDCFLDSGLL
jgi:hypothetical protein